MGPALLGVEAHRGSLPPLLHLGSPATEQPASCHSWGARPVLLGLGDSHGHQPGHAGGPSLQAGFWREIYFCWYVPTALRLNKRTRVQPWSAPFVHVLLQLEPGKALGSRKRGC